MKKLLNRNLKWKQQKDAKLYHQRLEREYEEKMECTFNPHISDMSKCLSK